LFLLTLVATGYDWYAWTFLFFLVLIYFWLNSDVALSEKFKALIPVLSGWLLVAISYVIQLLYFKDGIPQIIRTVKERSFTNQSDAKLDNFWQVLSERLLDYLPSHNLIIVSILIICATASLYCLLTNNWSWRLFASLFLLFITPLIHNLILANHTYIHSFSCFKLSLGIIFSYSVLPAILLTHYFENIKFYLLFSSLFGLMSFGILVSPQLMLTFSHYPSSNNFHEQLGNLLISELSKKQVAFSKTLYVPAFPPEGLWYANRRIYDYNYAKDIIQEFSLQNKPVEYVFVDREDEQVLAEICDPSQDVKHKSLLVTLGSGETVTEKIMMCMMCKMAVQNIVK
jgi:hypothetical protein